MQALIPIVAIVCLTVLSVVALRAGIDGALFGVVIAAIAGIAGFKLHDILPKRTP